MCIIFKFFLFHHEIISLFINECKQNLNIKYIACIFPKREQLLQSKTKRMQRAGDNPIFMITYLENFDHYVLRIFQTPIYLDCDQTVRNIGQKLKFSLRMRLSNFVQISGIKSLMRTFIYLIFLSSSK